MSASGVRSIIDLSVHPMFVGTNFYDDMEGHLVANCSSSSTLSSYPSSDCEIAEYYLCAEYGLNTTDYSWWDFIACGYINQTELDAGASTATFQNVIEDCASSYGLDVDALQQCYSSKGAQFLKHDYEHVTKYYTDAVWITVDGEEVTNSSLWLSSICDAYSGERPVGCGT
mmetsp:Transcript_47675/g.64920  ORF Transcript_47675/g.64920 Transcript_47675/m.64920 type:complete len:171 (-) Transcript_47675:333-845(-)